MCGIAGIVYADRERHVHPALLSRLLGAIKHRGPDDEGTHLDGPVGIGMRRLSIIDLAGGHQPIYDETRRRVIVFNGEIYNYRELRAELDRKGHQFRTASDTETVVHLHEDMGPACVERLRGMFGIALWDSEERELLLARDRFGIKPLYFVTASWGIAFASELKALHAADLVGSDLDWEALEGLFRVGYVPAPRTPFRNVHKLEPGHILLYRPGHAPIVRKYWDVPTGTARPRPDAEEAVRQRIDETVRAHLVADVPLAAFLSGGLDSSAVVSSMARAGGETHAYTVRYRGTGASLADETPLAAALARRYGIKLTIVDVEPDIRSTFEPIVRALDEPHADESAVPTWLLCERVAREYKVALVGTGGDELFAGYRRHFALAAAGAWQRVPAPLRSMASALSRRLPEPRGGTLGVSRLKRFLRNSGESKAALYVGLLDKVGPAPLFSADIMPEIEAGYTRQVFERHWANAPTDGRVRPALYVDYKTYLSDQLLHLADRVSMAHSIELRVPLVDHELVEDLFPIPDSVRIGWGRPKRLMRRALAPLLPEQHFHAPKRGFVGPTAMWLRHELADLLADELAPDRIRRLGYFDPLVVNTLRQEHMGRQQNNEGVLWALLCFLTWHHIYVEQRPPKGLPGAVDADERLTVHSPE